MAESRDLSLRADLDAGLRFTHAMGEQTRQEVFETGLTVLALIEELAGRGVVGLEELSRRIHEEQTRELARIGDHLKITMEMAIDKYACASPPVDCAGLMHICRGRCCTLHFPLSKQDLAERVVKWDYLNPYIIRQRIGGDGYCVHNDPETHFCTVYEHRPAVCRTYDCRNDKRIWVDFEKKIPTVDPSLDTRSVPVPLGEPPP